MFWQANSAWTALFDFGQYLFPGHCWLVVVGDYNTWFIGGQLQPIVYGDTYEPSSFWDGLRVFFMAQLLPSSIPFSAVDLAGDDHFFAPLLADAWNATCCRLALSWGTDQLLSMACWSSAVLTTVRPANPPSVVARLEDVLSCGRIWLNYIELLTSRDQKTSQYQRTYGPHSLKTFGIMLLCQGLAQFLRKFEHIWTIAVHDPFIKCLRFSKVERLLGENGCSLGIIFCSARVQRCAESLRKIGVLVSTGTVAPCSTTYYHCQLTSII